MQIDESVTTIIGLAISAIGTWIAYKSYQSQNNGKERKKIENDDR